MKYGKFRTISGLFLLQQQNKFRNKSSSILPELCHGKHILGKNSRAVRGVGSLWNIPFEHRYSCAMGLGWGEYSMGFPLLPADRACNKAGNPPGILENPITNWDDFCLFIISRNFRDYMGMGLCLLLN